MTVNKKDVYLFKKTFEKLSENKDYIDKIPSDIKENLKEIYDNFCEKVYLIENNIKKGRMDLFLKFGQQYMDPEHTKFKLEIDYNTDLLSNGKDIIIVLKDEDIVDYMNYSDDIADQEFRKELDIIEEHLKIARYIDSFKRDMKKEYSYIECSNLTYKVSNKLFSKVFTLLDCKISDTTLQIANDDEISSLIIHKNKTGSYALIPILRLEKRK